MSATWKRTIVLAAALAAAGCAAEEGAIQDPPAASPPAAADPWAGSGFSVWEVNGRWWVFLERSKELADFVKGGEPAKQVTRIGAGPGGQTLKAPDAETLDAFAAWKPGFSVRLQKGRVWIFREGSKDLAEYDRSGDLAKQVTRIGAGPNGATLKSADFETLDAWASAK